MSHLAQQFVAFGAVLDSSRAMLCFFGDVSAFFSDAPSILKDVSGFFTGVSIFVGDVSDVFDDVSGILEDFFCFFGVDSVVRGADFDIWGLVEFASAYRWSTAFLVWLSSAPTDVNPQLHK